MHKVFIQHMNFYQTKVWVCSSRSCSGLVISSFSKHVPDETYKKRMSMAIEQYKRYKKMLVLPHKFKGKMHINFFWVLKKCTLENELELNLRFVRIYFGVTTFDRITKDRAAKFVDMLSAIGGTMGLLTGFSIISGVEIIYFAAKLIFSMFCSRK